MFQKRIREPYTSRLSRWADRHFVHLTLSPALLVMFALTAVPTVLLISFSLSDWSLIGYKPSFVGLSNFISLFTEDPEFWRSFYVNILFTMIAVSAEFGIGFGLALLMDREFPGRGLFRSLLILPMVMTPVVVGLTWRVLYSPTFGMINYFQIGRAHV